MGGDPAALRSVLDHVTLADISTGKLPSEVTDLTHDRGLARSLANHSVLYCASTRVSAAA